MSSNSDDDNVDFTWFIRINKIIIYFCTPNHAQPFCHKYIYAIIIFPIGRVWNELNLMLSIWLSDVDKEVSNYLCINNLIIFSRKLRVHVDPYFTLSTQITGTLKKLLQQMESFLSPLIRSHSIKVKSYPSGKGKTGNSSKRRSVNPSVYFENYAY